MSGSSSRIKIRKSRSVVNAPWGAQSLPGQPHNALSSVTERQCILPSSDDRPRTVKVAFILQCAAGRPERKKAVPASGTASGNASTERPEPLGRYQVRCEPAPPDELPPGRELVAAGEAEPP
jgi:hypothetical protein